jgi:putative membrane protein
VADVKVLVLCVDRDDDFGSKTGLKGPFVGRQKNIEAALALGLKDPEDSDVNTLLAAIGIYEEMLKKGIDAEIACILGDVKVGYESDLVLVNQLEAVIDQVKPDRAVLVSDGAEDEFIYPMVFSRVKVDSVRRVYIKQAPTVESTYYTMVKMMKDDKIRKRILTPIGLIFLVIGIFSLIPKFLALASDPNDLDVIASLTWGMLSLVIGLYLLAYAYKVGERTRSGVGRMVRAVRSGSQMIPFIIVSSILFIIGLFLGYSYANEDPNLDLAVRSLLFVEGVLWLWVFSILTYETGRFVSYYLSNGKYYWPHVVVSLTVLASGFIIQGAVDSILLFLKEYRVSTTVVVLEFVAGFLFLAFSAIMNVTLRNLSQTVQTVTEQKDVVEYPEA